MEEINKKAYEKDDKLLLTTLTRDFDNLTTKQRSTLRNLLDESGK